MHGTKLRSGLAVLAILTVVAIATMLAGGSQSARADEGRGAHYEGTIEAGGSVVVGSISFDIPWEEDDWFGIVVSNVKGTCGSYDTCSCQFTSPAPSGWWAQFDVSAHTFTVHDDYATGGFEYINGSFPGYSTAEGTISLSQPGSPPCASGVRNWTAQVTSWPTATPTPSPSPTPSGSIEPTETEHTSTPSPTATQTETPTATPTPTPTSQTPSPTASASPPPVTPSPTPIPDESVTQDIPPGGTATTDTEGDGTTPVDPVETWVTSPVGGSVSIHEAPLGGGARAGFYFLGQDINIGAVPSPANNPLVITIQIDSSLLPLGKNAETLRMFKNGFVVPECTGAPGTADPDACVSSRQTLPDGDIRITVLSSSSSKWNTGRVARGNVDCDADVDPVDALAVAGSIAGLAAPSCYYVSDVNCDGQTTVTDLLAILRYAAGLPQLPIPANCPAIG